MDWSCISIDGGLLSPDCVSIRTAFQSRYETAAASEYDELALYVAKSPADPVTLYLSPRATSRFSAAESRLHLTPCERPDTEAVDLLLGHPLAWHTDWSELTFAERREWEDTVRLEHDDLICELGMTEAA